MKKIYFYIGSVKDRCQKCGAIREVPCHEDDGSPTLFEVEQAKIIERCLVENGNILSRAAAKLGMTPPTIRKWARRFHLGPYRQAA